MKPTPGCTDMRGVWKVSHVFDAVGGMAKSTLDLAVITELLLDNKTRSQLPPDGFLSYLHGNFKGLKLGFLDHRLWRWPRRVQKQVPGTLEQMVGLRDRTFIVDTAGANNQSPAISVR